MITKLADNNQVSLLFMAGHAHFRLTAWFAADARTDEDLREAVDCTKPYEEDLIFQRLHYDASKYLQVYAKMWSTVVADRYRTLQYAPRCERRYLFASSVRKAMPDSE